MAHPAAFSALVVLFAMEFRVLVSVSDEFVALAIYLNASAYFILGSSMPPFLL
jgi:hypothetical protein